MQINIGQLDEQGIYNGASTTYALSGYVRSMARASRPMPALLGRASRPAACREMGAGRSVLRAEALCGVRKRRAARKSERAA